MLVFRDKACQAPGMPARGEGEPTTECTNNPNVLAPSVHLTLHTCRLQGKGRRALEVDVRNVVIGGRLPRQSQELVLFRKTRIAHAQ